MLMQHAQIAVYLNASTPCGSDQSDPPPKKITCRVHAQRFLDASKPERGWN
jgi:hypothetical protein